MVFNLLDPAPAGLEAGDPSGDGFDEATGEESGDQDDGATLWQSSTRDSTLVASPVRQRPDSSARELVREPLKLQKLLAAAVGSSIIDALVDELQAMRRQRENGKKRP